MLTSREIVTKLAAHRDELREMGVASLAVFGSAARDEAGPRSDIDLLVEFLRPVGFFHFFKVQERLAEILGVDRVDLVSKPAVIPELRERIFAEARPCL
ncbi:MAG: nucleotidyltransferase family protein [Thermodesulfobacteriota bacterium]